jgi:hypothetical protein
MLNLLRYLLYYTIQKVYFMTPNVNGFLLSELLPLMSFFTVLSIQTASHECFTHPPPFLKVYDPPFNLKSSPLNRTGMHLFSCVVSVYHNVYPRYSLSNKTNDVANCVHFIISSSAVKSVSIKRVNMGSRI